MHLSGHVTLTLSPRRRVAAVVDEVFPVDDLEPEGETWSTEFRDVHDLLEEHQLGDDVAGDELPEEDVAGVLAAS